MPTRGVALRGGAARSAVRRRARARRRRPARGRRGACGARARARGDPRGREPGDLAERGRGASCRRYAPRPAPRPQRDRRDRPHEPRPCAAAEEAIAQVVEGARLLEPRNRPAGPRLPQDHVRPALGADAQARARREQQRRRRCCSRSLRSARGARLVSRGELIEIGAARSASRRARCVGARLVEVGTTNRTHAADYEQARAARAALLLRVHQSNFRVVGFTEQPSLEELVAVARRHGCRSSTISAPARSSSCRASRRRRSRSRRRRPSSASPATSCSGGPQAGIVVGRADLVEQAAPASTPARVARRQAVARGARGDAAPVPRRAGADPGAADAPPGRCAIGARARGAARGAVGGTLEETVGRVGGGALPLAELPSFACAIEEALAEPLRAGEPPIVGIVRDGTLLLDCRTLRTRRSTRSRPQCAMPLTSARRTSSRQDDARRRAHGQEHRPPARGAGSRHLDRSRLRAARARRRAAAVVDRRAGARALRPQHGRRRDGNRSVPRS